MNIPKYYDTKNKQYVGGQTPAAVLLYIAKGSTFLKQHGKQVEQLGGSYGDTRGKRSVREVKLPLNTDTTPLINALIVAYPVESGWAQRSLGAYATYDTAITNAVGVEFVGRSVPAGLSTFKAGSKDTVESCLVRYVAVLHTLHEDGRLLDEAPPPTDAERLEAIRLTPINQIQRSALKHVLDRAQEVVEITASEGDFSRVLQALAQALTGLAFTVKDYDETCQFLLEEEKAND